MYVVLNVSVKADFASWPEKLCWWLNRCPEALFQPSMLGHEHGGLVETLDFILKKFSPEERAELVKVCVNIK